MQKRETKPQNRLETLDHLRGFFIVVIILDHMSRWPSLLAVLTGKALLWVTAAEGFVIISGLLVGYVRGFKNRTLPMKDVSMKLWRRAFLLYVCSVIATIVYVVIMWYLPLKGGAPGMLIDKGDWLNLIVKTITMQHTFVWVHFLTLYALFLAASPLAIWLMRKGQSALIIVLSLFTLLLGHAVNSEPLQWQALFFIPSVAGYYLEDIQRYWKNLTAKRRNIFAGLIVGLTVLTIIISTYLTFYAPQTDTVVRFFDENLFAKDRISLWRLLVAFLWFTGFLIAFNAGRRFIGRFLGWLLLPFGTRSLSAYIIHGLAIIIISFTTVASDNILVNTFVDIACVMIVWLLLKTRIVQRFVPA